MGVTHHAGGLGRLQRPATRASLVKLMDSCSPVRRKRRLGPPPPDANLTEITLAERRRRAKQRRHLLPGDRFKQAREICGRGIAAFSGLSGVSWDRIIQIELSAQATDQELQRWIFATGFPRSWFFKSPCVDFVWCSL